MTHRLIVRLGCYACNAVSTHAHSHGMASPFVGHHPSFVDVLGAAPRLLRLIDAPAHEGPVYASDEHALYVTSTPTPAHESSILRIPLTDDRIPALRGEVTVLVEFTGGANGMTLDRDSALLACVQGNMTKRAAIARVDRRTGEMTTIVDGWGDLPLNSPNDVVLHSDGTIWFTDPSYGHLQGFRPPPRAGDHVYRYEPRTRRLTVVSDEQVKPNGLAFSPDETVLYRGRQRREARAGELPPSVATSRGLLLRGGWPPAHQPQAAQCYQPRLPGRAESRPRRTRLHIRLGRRARPRLGRPTSRPDRRPGRRELLFRWARVQRFVHHNRRGHLGRSARCRRPSPSLTAAPPGVGPTSPRSHRMIPIRSRRVLTDAGVESVVAAAEALALAKRYRVVIT